MATLRVMNKTTNTEVEAELIGTVSLTDGSGRRHVTVKQPNGEKHNVGIIDSAGNVEPQPGYDIIVEK